MQTSMQTSGVLIVGPASAADFGAAHVADLSTARTYLEAHRPSLLVFGPGRGSELQEFGEFVREKLPTSLWIINDQGIPPALLVDWNNTGHLHDLIDGLDDPSLEKKLHSALEAIGEQQQRQDLLKLFADQSQRLKRLSGELESRVERRQKALRKSLSTLDQTKIRLESLHRALLGIHRASSQLQMEESLCDSLKESISLEWVKIRFAHQSLLPRQFGAHVLRIDLPLADPKMHAEVLLCKAQGEAFTNHETDFLQELAEALGLAVMRLHKLDQAEMLRAQWQATFDSIPHALSLTSKDFEILKLNRAFQQACVPKTFRALIGKNCFAEFFGEDFNPPPSLACPFSFRNARTGRRGTEHYEVIGEQLTFDEQTAHLVLLRSITEEVRFERRIFESSKLAELGTIGSSIAHELNNPLGGMLSFLQLMLLDLRVDEAPYGEIKEMEAAVLRCRDIILNLLSFARKQDLGEFATVELNVVLQRAIKLVELQSKSKGIAIEWLAYPPMTARGSLNALVQVFNNILQNAVDTLSEKMRLDPAYTGKINIHCMSEKRHHHIRISDNGMGIAHEVQTRIFNPLFTTRDSEQHTGMGLTTAFTIISEHHGTLEILSQTGSGTTAILTLPALDDPLESAEV